MSSKEKGLWQLRKTITVPVTTCARCGEDHERVVFKRLTRPGKRHTHWAKCPVNGEPIMLFIKDSK